MAGRAGKGWRGWSRSHSLIHVGSGCTELVEHWLNGSGITRPVLERGRGRAEVSIESCCLWSECLARKNVELSQRREKQD